MRYRYKDPLGCEREYDGDMDDILDFIEETKVIDLSATTDLTCVSIIFKVPDDDDQIVIISSCNK